MGTKGTEVYDHKMSSGSEALSKLRAAVSAKQTIRDAGDSVQLEDGTKLPKSLETPLRMIDDARPVSVGSIALYVMNSHNITEYTTLVAKERARFPNLLSIKFVAGRRELLPFLQGELASVSKYFTIDGDAGANLAGGDHPAGRGSAVGADGHLGGTDADGLRSRGDKSGAEGTRVGDDGDLDGTGSRQKPRQSPEDMLLRKIQKREGVRRDRINVLMSSHNFAADVLRLVNEAHRGQGKHGMPGMQGGRPETKRRLNIGCPIIVVPAAPTAPITLYNVRDFLVDGHYVHPMEAKKRDPARRSEVYIEKKIGEYGFIRFKIVDSVKRFQDQHWNRLAAVITFGPEWQFKDWRLRDTAQIFNSCRGLHIYFDDKKLEPHISDWNVVKIPLKKESRHQDSLQQHRVWDEIEHFLVHRKPELLESGRIKTA